MKHIKMLLLSCSIFTIAGMCRTQSITINEAIAISFEKNPDIQHAKEQLKSVSTKRWSAVSPENPHLFMEYAGLPENSNRLSDYEEKKYGITQGIEFPLAYYLRARLQSFRSEQALSEFINVRNTVLYQVKSTFYRVLLLVKKKQLFSAMYDLTEKLYQKAQVKVQAGEAPAYEALKVKVDLSEIENQALRIDKELENARLAFALLLGEQDSGQYQLIDALKFEPFTISLDSLKSLMLVNHPTLADAAAFEKIKRTERTLKWIQELMPALEVRYFRQEHPGTDMPKAWGGEIGVSIPLWFGLKGQGNLRTAAHKLYAARHRSVSQKNILLEKLNRAHSNLIVAEKLVVTYRDNILEETEELVRIATRSYEEGEMGYLEVTEALRTLNRIRIGYAETLFEFFRAKAELEKVSGF